MRSAVVVDVIRTATGRGKVGGALSGVHPVDLLAGVLASLVRRNDLDPALVDDVIAGCVTQVDDQGINIGRTALLAAGFPESVPATTVDRQCGSSQQAVHFAAQGVIAGAYDVAIACGVESMSRVPLESATADGAPWSRLGERYGDRLVDQGVSGEIVAARAGLGRDDLDRYAERSHRLATEHRDRGDFDHEIVAVELPDGARHHRDETIRDTTTVESLAGLRPVFADEAARSRHPEIGDWSITAGNSSPLSDGASAALVVEESVAERLGLTPRARLASFAVAGSDPVEMLTGVIPATTRLLERSGLTLDEIDTYEVNEAFASVPLAWAAAMSADPDRLNPCGGAIALGHPVGASGTRLLATLVNHLERTGGRRGLQTMCERGGMANALLVERI